ncbi:MAG TPA: hypothetical protein VFF67_10400 [Thermoplasmata archaeon]|nr:hypothetical protein [Thermoplasmata archaeon]
MAETRTYTIRGDPEAMLDGLRAALPTGASLEGDSTHGQISAVLIGKIVTYGRTGTALTVTVHRSAPGRSIPQIWDLIERGLSRFV